MVFFLISSKFIVGRLVQKKIIVGKFILFKYETIYYLSNYETTISTFFKYGVNDLMLN